MTSKTHEPVVFTDNCPNDTKIRCKTSLDCDNRFVFSPAEFYLLGFLKMHITNVMILKIILKSLFQTLLYSYYILQRVRLNIKQKIVYIYIDKHGSIYAFKFGNFYTLKNILTTNVFRTLLLNLWPNKKFIKLQLIDLKFG